MDPLAPLVEKASPKVSEETFRAKVDAYRVEFDGLLDDEALALLVLDELGLNDDAVITLADARERPEATVEVEVAGEPSRRVFTRKDGSEGEVTNVPIGDATATARLVLWGRDGEKAADLEVGTRFKIVNARVKDDRWGLELHHSPWTVLEVPGALSPAKAKLLADVKEDAGRGVSGVIVRIQPTRTYKKADGGVGFACTILVRTGGGEESVTAYDELVKAVREKGEGAKVDLRPLVVEGGTLRTTSETRVA